MARGSSRLTKPLQTPNTGECELGRQTSGANVRTQEGNNPDRQLRSLKLAKWETKWEGLNQSGCWLRSSHHLMKVFLLTDRVVLRGRCNGAKPVTEAADLHASASGRRAFRKPVKGKVRGAGGLGRANAGLS